MPFALTFTVQGDEQLNRSFSRFADNVKDATVAFERIAKDFHEIVEPNQFSSQGHGLWAPLSPSYAAWKARNYPGKPLMVRTGLMLESLMGQNPWSIEEINPLQMKLGTKLGYPVYHQTGRGRPPRRRVIDLTEEDKSRWTHILHGWLLEAHRGS